MFSNPHNSKRCLLPLARSPVPGVEAFKVVGKEVKLTIDVELNRADPAAKPAEKPAAAPAKK